MKTRLRALTLGLAVAAGSALLVPAPAHADARDDATAAISALSSDIEDGAADRGFNDAGLGAQKGPITESGKGFKQLFDGGTIFWSEDTGAHVLYGAIDARYEQQNDGPSDIGFPDADESDGTISSPSRVAEFAGAGNPMIFWTPAKGAWLVRGPFSMASDKLGNALGAPTGEMTVDGSKLTQTFLNGTLVFDTETGTWSSTPASLAPELKGLALPTAASNYGLPGVAIAETKHETTPAAEPATATESEDSEISAWWWMLLLALPLLLFILAWFRGRNDYDYKTFEPATGPGFPAVSPERAKRLAALASGSESSAAGAIAKAQAAAAAAALPVRRGARVPSEGGAVPLPIGASRPLRADAMLAPDGYPIKAVTETGLYYRPGQAEYDAIKPDLWFATVPTAATGGFEPAAD